jgi:hypothetical protein
LKRETRRVSEVNEDDGSADDDAEAAFDELL